MPIPAPGETFLSKYALTRELGRGGMGVVFAAHHIKLNAPVAIKFLLPELAARADVATRFLQEARAGTLIKNPHVARVLDADSAGDTHFMVMDFLEGETLAALLARRAPLPVSEAVDLLLQVCEAVNAAHGLGIVHRDLKPGNLFVTTDPDGLPFVKVLDFGISKFDDVSITSSVNVLGTPLYMSPEQLTDAANVDARADVWSLGVILYEMVAGRRPFSGATSPAIHIAVLTGQYAKVSTVRDDLPRAFEQAIEAALVGDRDGRVASVEAFAASIAPFGSSAGGGSFAQIQKDAARSSQSSGAPAVSARPVPSSNRAGIETAPGSDTNAFGTMSEDGRAPPALLAPSPPSPPVASSPPPTSAKRRRWTPVLGAGAAVVVLLGVLAARPYLSTGKTESTFPPAAASSAPATAEPCASGATPACEAACTANQPGACHGLAKGLEHGVGAPADLARAKKLYETECDGGGMGGCNNLAGLYASGSGVERDEKKAVDLYDQACTGGHAVACLNLGSMFLDGRGVLKNPDSAAKQFRIACAKNVALGCLSLSIAYGTGQGVEQDDAKAFPLAQQACSMGAPEGCVRVANAILTGQGVDKDVKKGLGALEAMCAGRQPAGCKGLVGLYEHGLGTDVHADPIRVREYAKKWCDIPDQEGCAMQVALQKADSTETRPAQLVEQAVERCGRKEMEACVAAGQAYMTGVGVPVDKVEGARLWGIACKGGVKRVCGGALGR